MRLIDADAIEWKGFEKDIGKFVFKRQVDEMPTVDPVKHERWDVTTEERPWGVANMIRCSGCGDKHVNFGDISKFPKFCQECGARMDKQ